jgi:hypothetical protein
MSRYRFSSWSSAMTALPELLHHGEGVADRLRRQRAAHQEPDVERFGDLLVGGAQVEDLLDAVVDSVEAVL